MSAKERKEYTSAVNCLMKLPPKTDPALAPGVRNRYDDFVAQHINQTRSIHGTVSTRGRANRRAGVKRLTQAGRGTS